MGTIISNYILLKESLLAPITESEVLLIGLISFGDLSISLENAVSDLLVGMISLFVIINLFV